VTTLRITDGDVTSARAQVLVVGVTRTDELKVVSGALPTSVRRAIIRDLERIGCSADSGSTWRIPAPASLAADSVLAVGTQPKPDVDEVREAAGAALRACAGVKSVVVALPTASQQALAAVCEGALLGAHLPLRISSKAPGDPVASIAVATTAPRAARSAVKRNTVADVKATSLARDLVNEPPVSLTPAAFAATAKKQCKGLPIKVTVWEPDRLLKESMGGIMGVGQGSANPPRLIHLEYAPKDVKRHLAFVGKGITFDSGGLSLKPAKAMETMKCDMAGAAAVLAATRDHRRARPAGADQRVPRLRGEHAQWHRPAPRRCDHHARRHHCGGPQHRCRGAAGDGRRPRAGRGVAARCAHRRGHTDRRPDDRPRYPCRSCHVQRRVPVWSHPGRRGQVGERFWPMPLPDALRTGPQVTGRRHEEHRRTVRRDACTPGCSSKRSSPTDSRGRTSTSPDRRSMTRPRTASPRRGAPGSRHAHSSNWPAARVDRLRGSPAPALLQGCPWRRS
jgi:hypothetical protein